MHNPIATTTRALLFIASSSVDGSADLLVEISVSQGIDVFRWNVDLWKRYRYSINENEFIIQDPRGRIYNLLSDDGVLLWRKPFIDSIIGSTGDLLNSERLQISALLREIEAVFRSKSRVALIEPRADQRNPKIYQLREAAKFFKVPAWDFLKASKNFKSVKVVAKPLQLVQLADGRIWYTTVVTESDLDPEFPWFTQELIVGLKDVTCVFIAGECHWFVCDFSRDEVNVDWRTEINTTHQSSWRNITNELQRFSPDVVALMRKLKLHYGRLDFILDENEVLWFLEVNSNGQFGWLDDENLTLHKEFLRAALDPINSVY